MVVPSKNTKALALEMLKRKVIIMKLSKSLKEADCKLLGDPLIIADQFHFTGQVYWALDAVRCEVQHDLDKKERIRRKQSK